MSIDSNREDERIFPKAQTDSRATNPPVENDKVEFKTINSEPRLAVANPRQLMWRRFRKHKLAVFGGILIIVLYTVAFLAEFLSPSLPGSYNSELTYAPPQIVRFELLPEDGGLVRAFVYGYESSIDSASWRRTVSIDRETKYPIGFFVRRETYKLWGLFESDLHFIGPLDDSHPFHLLGTDRLGRDVLTRTIYGTRISMTISLVGIALSLFLGVVLGGISGYFGGPIDTLIQKIIEVLRSVPTIPLWMGLSAAIPLTWPPVQVYFAITIILSLVTWTTLAREVRGRFLSLKTEAFVTSARLDGNNEMRVILRHLAPSFLSHIIATVTLTVPTMIIAEASLSFLGIGLRPPAISWGVMLQEAQNVRSIAGSPWLFVPALAIVVAVLSFNFLGDGIRDAADPYSK